MGSQQEQLMTLMVVAMTRSVSKSTVDLGSISKGKAMLIVSPASKHGG